MRGGLGCTLSVFGNYAVDTVERMRYPTLTCAKRRVRENEVIVCSECQQSLAVVA